MKTNSHVYAGSDAIHSQDTDRYDNLFMFHDEILLRKCVEDHVRDDDGKVLVHMTDKYIDTTLWCEVVSIGKQCKYLRTELLDAHKVFMSIPEFEGRGWHKIGDNLFVIREHLMDKKSPLLQPFVVLEDK